MKKPLPKATKAESEKVSPFAWIDSVTQKTGGDMIAEHGERGYPAFMVNRGLSYFPDTIMYANEMNQARDLDPRLQYDFYWYGLRKARRTSKWSKKASTDAEKTISEYYKCSLEKAESYARILTQQDVEEMRTLMDTGKNN